MKKNLIAMAGILVLVAAVRSDLSWGEIGFGPGQNMDPSEALKEARASEAPAAPRTILTGCVAGNDPSAGKSGQPVERVSMLADVAGVRETVRKLTVSVARTCGADGPRYVLQPVAADLGPSLSVSGDSLDSDYLYPQENGLQLVLAGDAPGAALSVRSSGGEARALGTVAAPATGPCSPYPMSSVEVRLAQGVSAEISVEPRTGIFRPACYKDIINGFYKLDTWTVLTLAFPQETMTVKAKDGMSFPDEPQCRAFYARLMKAR